jgi:hypothetical protein
MIRLDLKPSASQAQNISPKNVTNALKHATSMSDRIFTMKVTRDKDAVNKFTQTQHDTKICYSTQYEFIQTHIKWLTLKMPTLQQSKFIHTDILNMEQVLNLICHSCIKQGNGN